MERLERNEVLGFKQPETTTDLFLKWGNKKRLRCVRMKDMADAADPPYAVSGRRRIRRRINSQFVAFPSDNNTNNYNSNDNIKQPSHPSPPTRLTRNSETVGNPRSENQRKPSPEKETNTVSPVNGVVLDQKKKHVWPKLYITLSSREKEEDFMAMKGCRPSHRPKKRPKAVQRSLLLVSPGGWLTDICQDRYEVIEKKNTKKRPRGLKAMGSVESDSE